MLIAKIFRFSRFSSSILEFVSWWPPGPDMVAWLLWVNFLPYRIVQLTLNSQKLPAFIPSKEKAFRRWATGCMENCLHVFVWTSNQLVFLMPPKFPSSNHYHSLFSTSWHFLYLQRLLVCATITPYGLLLGLCCFLMSDTGLLSSLSILS